MTVEQKSEKKGGEQVTRQSSLQVSAWGAVHSHRRRKTMQTIAQAQILREGSSITPRQTQELRR